MFDPVSSSLRLMSAAPRSRSAPCASRFQAGEELSLRLSDVSRDEAFQPRDGLAQRFIGIGASPELIKGARNLGVCVERLLHARGIDVENGGIEDFLFDRVVKLERKTQCLRDDARSVLFTARAFELREQPLGLPMIGAQDFGRAAPLLQACQSVRYRGPSAKTHCLAITGGGSPSVPRPGGGSCTGTTGSMSGGTGGSGTSRPGRGGSGSDCGFGVWRERGRRRAPRNRTSRHRSVAARRRANHAEPGEAGCAALAVECSITPDGRP